MEFGNGSDEPVSWTDDLLIGDDEAEEVRRFTARVVVSPVPDPLSRTVSSGSI
jgi:hypothetical protein